jgi:hypothetical protein
LMNINIKWFRKVLGCLLVKHLKIWLIRLTAGRLPKSAEKALPIPISTNLEFQYIGFS